MKIKNRFIQQLKQLVFSTIFYKTTVFELCHTFGEEKEWRELNMGFAKKRVEFQVIFENEWKNRINKIFEIGKR